MAARFFAATLDLDCQAMTAMGLVGTRRWETPLRCRRQRWRAYDGQALLRLLAQQPPAQTCVADSDPRIVCANKRAGRSRLYQEAAGASWATAPPSKPASQASLLLNASQSLLRHFRDGEVPQERLGCI